MDRIEHANWIVEDVIVPETQNSEGLRSKKCVPPEVAFAFDVLRSIGFDNQSALQANEISDVGIDDHLTPEFEHRHSPVA
jgi:hypothetical protein